MAGGGGPPWANSSQAPWPLPEALREPPAPPPDPNLRIIKQRHWRARLWHFSLCECEGKICEARVGSYRYLRLRLRLLQKRYKLKKLRIAERASRLVNQHLKKLVVERRLRDTLATRRVSTRVPVGGCMAAGNWPQGPVVDNRVPRTPPRWYNDWTGC